MAIKGVLDPQLKARVCNDLMDSGWAPSWVHLQEGNITDVARATLQVLSQMPETERQKFLQSVTNDS